MIMMMVKFLIQLQVTIQMPLGQRSPVLLCGGWDELSWTVQNRSLDSSTSRRARPPVWWLCLMFMLTC